MAKNKISNQYMQPYELYQEDMKTEYGQKNLALLNLEKALETISKRLLEQIKDGETPSRELGELAKVMKQAVEIRQELQEEHGGQETGVRVVFEREAEEFSE